MARKKKVEQVEPTLGPEELALKAKYPHQRIVAGSYGRFSDESTKKSVVIECQAEGCTEVRRVATSDLFQVSRCPEHAKQAKLAKRRKQKSE